MGIVKFLKENWIWWVAPIVIVLGGVALLFALGSDEVASDFHYALF
jgi:hypothetical protein